MTHIDLWMVPLAVFYSVNCSNSVSPDPDVHDCTCTGVLSIVVLWDGYEGVLTQDVRRHDGVLWGERHPMNDQGRCIGGVGDGKDKVAILVLLFLLLLLGMYQHAREQK